MKLIFHARVLLHDMPMKGKAYVRNLTNSLLEPLAIAFSFTDNFRMEIRLDCLVHFAYHLHLNSLIVSAGTFENVDYVINFYSTLKCEQFNPTSLQHV